MGKNVENCQLMQICFHLYKRKKVRWVENAPLRQKKESFSLKAICRVHAQSYTNRKLLPVNFLSWTDLSQNNDVFFDTLITEKREQRKDYV